MSLWDRTRGTCHILLTGWSLVKRAEGVVLVAPAGSCISPCPVDGGGGFHAVASFWVAATSGRGVWVGAVGPKRGVRRRRWRGWCGDGEVPGSVGILAAAGGLDLGGCPLSVPVDSVVGDPVVGLAGKVPVADRGVQRDGDAVEGEAPSGGSDRGDDLLAAAA